ncbi:MAG: ATP-binding cassette domain-containing protein [Bacteroidales bacterium]|nr:ATP-binding cassette domain-containing protein [Bacteroidales bacterium]
MIIRLEKLKPLPLTEIPTDESSLWEADPFLFEGGKKYLVEAASGRGKTSLLSMIYGLRHDYSGKLLIDGADAAQLKAGQWSGLRKKQLSYIFQGLELFDDLSALDNIRLKNRITGFKSEQQIEEMAGRLDITGSLKKKCRILSFGQQQRVAIIRALCQPFRFLLADECFSHIDKKNGNTAMQLITEACEEQEAGLILTSLGNNREGFDKAITL